PKAFEEGVPFDGSSIEGFTRISESDMYLKPDPENVLVYPWESSTSNGLTYKNAGVICDVYQPDDTHFNGDPRWCLKQVAEKARKSGYKMYTGPEPEFFLFERDPKSSSPILTDRGSYFDLIPVDKGEQTRKDIVIDLEKVGFHVETAHHEAAPSQHEIDFQYEEALHTADHLSTFKTTTKTIALQRGLHATFMPKPLPQENGSGMHTHISLFKDGDNCFYNPNKPYNLSDMGLHFIAGIIDHIDAITALANPTVNSYKRLVPGYEAPVNVSWGQVNRSALIRIPSTNTPEVSTRIELRSPDPTANPYLAFAAILRAGLEGVEKGLQPPEPVDEDIYNMASETKKERRIHTLPQTLGEALDHLEKDELIQETLGPHIYPKYLKAKRTETKEYNTIVTDWEIDKYMTYY
ncbi:MAG: glutamine synthetase family protein, partial [Candidatus Acetothermia bacterium]